MAAPIKKKVTQKNRRTAAAATHARKSKDRAVEIADIKSLYIKESENPVLLDVMKKLRSFADYHTKMAKDGVGARKTGDKYENGQDVMETVYYSAEKRLSELDKAAGLEEMLAYVERQFEVAPIQTQA